MEQTQEEHFGRFLKLNSFLGIYAADFIVNPGIAADKVLLANVINGITLNDAIANSDDRGFTTMKTNSGNALRGSIRKISYGLTSYFETVGHAGNLEKAKMTEAEIDYPDDADLNMKASLLYAMGNVPAVKTDPLLATGSLLPGDIDELEVKRLAYMNIVTLPDDKRADRVAANKEKARLFEVGNKEIVPRLFNRMQPFRLNPVLYSKYETANMIDNIGGSGGTDGYNIETLNIPAGASLIVPLGPGPIAGSMEIYIRSVQGTVWVCTTILPAVPCMDGYSAQQGVTYKGPVSGLNINLNNTHLQVTNPGTEPAILRIGIKSE